MTKKLNKSELVKKVMNLMIVHLVLIYTSEKTSASALSALLKNPISFFSEFSSDKSNKETYYDSLRNKHIDKDEYQQYKTMVLSNFQKSRQYEKIYIKRNDEVYEM
ncbi:MAG: hypothetical protein CMB64_03490 [Euryarchaeota archaeon]|nr:hypothetical protein [Euryarchaeota archaeon]|tara:strand:- start:65 stop:382 length:318 start_codon:yes stop_codon:yes gene_type:complete